MLAPGDHDKLLDLWELFRDRLPSTLSPIQSNLHRDLEVALGLVRTAKEGKARLEATDRCLRAWEGYKAAISLGRKEG